MNGPPSNVPTRDPGMESGRRFGLGHPAVARTARLLLPMVGLAVGVGGLVRAQQSSIGAYGLIQALPVAYFIGLGLVIVSFPFTWSADRLSRAELVVELVALTLLLQGAASFVEAEPRFPSAWLLAGFTGYVDTHGKVLALTDARFSWPSFFAGVALLGRTGSVPSFIFLLKWWPVVIDLLCLPPLFILARFVLGDERRAAVAVWLFPFVNWVGQDYFSPQSIAFLLYMVVLVLVLGPFGGRFPPIWRWRTTQELGSPSAPAESERAGVPFGRSLMLLVILGLLTLALATGHQLTPVFAVEVVALLAIVGRTRLRVFSAWMAVVTLGWICYGAIAFWAGHPEKVFGRLGRVGGNVSSSLVQRVGGTDAHRLLTETRVGVAALIWGLAVVGAVVARRSPQDRLSPLIIMLAPLLVLIVQSYGGEGGLRVYLVSLPGAISLIALLLTFKRIPGKRLPDGADPTSFKPGWVNSVAVLVLTGMLVPIFFLARWGNELYEQVPTEELAGVNALYRLAPAGSTLLAMDSHLPWRSVSIIDYNYVSSNLAEFVHADVGGMEHLLQKNPVGGFVIVTAGQIAYATQTNGLAPDWNVQVESAMTASGHFAIVYQNTNTRIYRYEP
jgi:hypothetical protein